MYLDFEHDRPMALAEGMHFIGRTGRFLPVRDVGARLYRVHEDKSYAVTGTKNHLWVEASVAKPMGPMFFDAHIDMSYYDGLVEDAKATIGKFGDIEGLLE